ncbi:phosphotransferase [Microbacterium sp. NPDC091662]|uniref:phosphotransferase n=1 Tax=Microbacterium sp. NPDC091662 TaxID=3364211 RepID=UPI0038140240
MHEGELALEPGVAAQLIARRFPELRGVPLRPVSTTGTVNRIIRVGDALVARFPIVGASVDELVREAAALDEFAASSPFPAPRSYGTASASEEFDSAWAVQTWIEGDVADPERSATSEQLAHDLVALISALRCVDVRGRVFDGRGRGGSLGDHDEWVATCLMRSEHLVDTARAARLWAALRELPSADTAVMSHRDLTPFNLLIAEHEGATRLAGVLDGGDFGPADPALDLVAAWHLFDAPVRRIIRAGVCPDDAEWHRGAAWALQQALGLGWYYARSNPAMSALGISTVERVLADAELSALVD